MNMVFTMGFRVQIFGRRCALEPAFFFIKRQYTEQLTDKQGEQFWAVSTCQKHLVINEEEAKTVRLIFFSYLYGYSTAKIADALTELEWLTKRGNQTWSSGTVLQILTNERYCGDVLARKTFTPNYLNHKSKKNRHDRNQYRQKNHHDCIISREDFFAVQKMIRNAKYGNKGYFPEMHVIQDGILKGYVTVHPRWAGFTEDDYYMASESLETGQIPSKPITITLNKGSIDLSGMNWYVHSL